jgi:hypothetical protein
VRASAASRRRRPARHLLPCLGALVAALVACGETPAPDAGPEPDAGLDAGTPDGGPLCTPGCEVAEACCAEDEGPVCRAVLEDIENCGLCGIDCTENSRGDRCFAGTCRCGDAQCVGAAECCPPRNEGGEPYCANPFTSLFDCGGCDQECDLRISNQCAGGVCVCGDTRGPCEGGTFCCGASCVDLFTDDAHCGQCGRRCTPDERCVNGLCTFGENTCTSCPSPSAEVCCNGVCCNEELCRPNGVCGFDDPDGGAPDAGPRDAGPSDGGSVTDGG